MEFGILLSLFGVIKLIVILILIPILFCPFDIRGREPYSFDFVKKKEIKNKTKTFDIGVYSDIRKSSFFQTLLDGSDH